MMNSPTTIIHLPRQTRHTRTIERRHFHIHKKQSVLSIQKALGISAVLLIIGLCTWQLIICIQKYLAQPVGMSIKVETFQQYTLPSITICPSSMLFFYQFGYHCQNNKACKSLSDETKRHSPFNVLLNRTLLDLWQLETKMTIETFIHHYQRNMLTPLNRIQHGIVNTNGACQLFKTNLTWNFLGTALMISFKNTYGFDFYVDVSTSPSDLFETKAYVRPNREQHLEISATTFEYLNTKRKPCSTKEQEIECMNKLIFTQLQTPDIKCRLPFINSTLPLCNTLFQVKNINNKIFQLQQHPAAYYCTRPCTDIKYTLDVISEPIKSNKYLIEVDMKTNTRIVVSEYFTYPISTLISDVGGSIGLFLGISLLSLIDFVRSNFNKIYNEFIK
uniref:Uncharacterized protein n=1 Tax=Strigamia maritima TaxID=126957 RepID=T1INH1_STRMM